MTNVSNSIDRFVGMRLRLQRERLQLSLEQLSRGLGISENELSDYEKGGVRLSALLLQKIAHRLDVPPSYFFTGMAVVSTTPVEEKPRVTGCHIYGAGRSLAP
jgi:transcriptional regulator with XRE-family HTH domain